MQPLIIRKKHNKIFIDYFLIIVFSLFILTTAILFFLSHTAYYSEVVVSLLTIYSLPSSEIENYLMVIQLALGIILLKYLYTLGKQLAGMTK